ncbi:MAG: hypothetical protein R3F54_19285 [Alphaproteobacteria bacterium]
MAGPSRDKIESLALVLPFLGLFLLMPPAVLAFGVPAMIAGVPLIVIYLFAVWALLIVIAAWLARRLRPRAELERAMRDPAPTSGRDRPD